MKDIKSIWQVPKYLPYVQPDLTDQILKDAEREIGFKLPDEYIALLKIQNGGYIRYTMQDIPHSQIYGIGPYFPSILQFDWLEDYEEVVSFELKGLIPFDGDGHWYICLDYRNNSTRPEITYIDTEIDEEEVIAATFREYLDMLVMDVENEFFIETNLPVEDVLKEISAIANIEFEAPDYFAHGYPIYRAKYHDGWVWLSPNRVPAGFIRKGENRYEELKSQMDTTGIRFPEIGAGSVLISTSEEETRQELFDLLKAGGIAVKELDPAL